MVAPIFLSFLKNGNNVKPLPIFVKMVSFDIRFDVFYGVFMKFLIVFACFLIQGCGGKPNAVDPEIAPLYKEFIADAGRYGRFVDTEAGLEVAFVPSMADGHVGLCSIPGGVSLSREFWDKSDYITRKGLVYHELGHCMLMRRHSEDPKSIMQPFVEQWQAALTGHYDYALWELFQ